MHRLFPTLVGAVAAAALLVSSAVAFEDSELDKDLQALRKLNAAFAGAESPEAKQKAFVELEEGFKSFIARHDGEVTEGVAYCALGLAHAVSGDKAKGGKILADYQKQLVGKPAPSLEVYQVVDGGKSWTLEQQRGKVVLVDFWATWCGPCRRSLPHLIELANAFEDEGLVVVGATQYYGYGYLGGKSQQGLTRDAELKLNSDFKKEMSIPYDVVFCEEGNSALTYGVLSIPTVALIDKKGMLRYLELGGDDETVEKKIKELLAEELPSGS